MRILRTPLGTNEAASVLRLAGERDPSHAPPCPISPSLSPPVTHATLHAARALVAHTMRGDAGSGDAHETEVRARDIGALAQLEEAAAAAVEEPVVVGGRAGK